MLFAASDRGGRRRYASPRSDRIPARRHAPGLRRDRRDRGGASGIM